MKSATCARSSPPSGKTVGMYPLVEACVKLNHAKETVLVVQTGTMRRLNRLVKEGVAKPTIIVDKDDETKMMRDWPPGCVAMIPCTSIAEAQAKTILMRNIMSYGFVWIFSYGKLVGAAEEISRNSTHCAI